MTNKYKCPRNCYVFLKFVSDIIKHTLFYAKQIANAFFQHMVY
jgi:hypothetical protein